MPAPPSPGLHETASGLQTPCNASDPPFVWTAGHPQYNVSLGDPERQVRRSGSSAHGVMRVKKTLAGSVPCVWENSARNCPLWVARPS